MLTLDLELEKSLQAIARQEHSSPNDLIRKLLSDYLRRHQDKNSPSINQASHETLLQSGPEMAIPPITQSLTGLLAKSRLDEADYKQHLVEKYL